MRTRAKQTDLLPIQVLLASCNKMVIVNICLLLLVVVNALVVVYSKHMARQYYAQLQQLASQQDDYHTQWTQLMLEQSTWATNARVEDIASKHLHMQSPKPQHMARIQTQ